MKYYVDTFIYIILDGMREKHYLMGFSSYNHLNLCLGIETFLHMQGRFFI